MDPFLKNIIRVGLVSSINPVDCKARVVFQDRGDLVSYELPVLQLNTYKNKDYWMPDPGEQVVCIFLPSGNAQGYIIGSVYSKKDKPPVTDENKRHIKFDDGTVIEYDRKTHILKIEIVENGPINIIAPGNVNVIGDVIADGISLKTHTHSGVVTGSGNTGRPVGGA